MKTCYYELLGVQSTADDSELKKAYRRKALQYHPDKNRDNVEEATETFGLIRAAYEVLSDPQERAWYDTHKQQILNDNFDGGTYQDDDECAMNAAMSGVTAEEVLMFFNTSLYTRIDDTPAGFYQIAGKVFARVAKDEVMHGRMMGLKQFNNYDDDYFEAMIAETGYVKACNKRVKQYISDNSCALFPPFGCSSTDYELLKEFYKKWTCFSTVKSFRWKDEYMYSNVYDRRTKREINKRNDKARQQAKNEYNKTVRRYVGFIKKLDRRMQEGDRRVKEMKREKERQKFQELRNASKKSKPEFEMQGWQNIDEEKWKTLDKLYSDESGGSDENDSEDEVEIIYDCFVCNKKFKSENQLENHNVTKAHRRNLSKIQRQMKKENFTLGLDELSDLDDYASADTNASGAAESDIDSKNDDASGDVSYGVVHDAEDSSDDDEMKNLKKELANIESQLAGMERHDDTEEISVDEAPEVEVEAEVHVSESDHSSGDNRDPELEKLLASLGKDVEEAKSNNNFKSKKPEKSPKPFSKHTCGTCKEAFPSRNKLFAHVHSTGHAAPPSKVNSKQRKRKKAK
ncbi:JJJ1 (YNL227C) [Zygosaccharomyces parabailii]|nr:JJJ1 (YNL227C) [Zygosaccharomyces parabailii]